MGGFLVGGGVYVEEAEGVDLDVAFGGEEDVVCLEESAVALAHDCGYALPNCQQVAQHVQQVSLLEVTVGLQLAPDGLLQGVVVVAGVGVEADGFGAEVQG